MDKQAEIGFRMTAKTFHGLEEVLADEIRELGGKDIQILNRAVQFQGDKGLLYKSNLHLRTAIRILIPLIEAPIKNQIDLYNRVREYEWEKHIESGKTLAIDSFIHSSTFSNSHFVSLRTKDAIVDRLRDKFGRRPSINTTNPDVFVNVHLSGNNLTVSLDTSGPSLHKRGYRKADGPAPLNEVLAAGMILLTGWKGETDFYDPMCGSGTLGIEAALIARKIPPGIFRKQFGFENSPDFDAGLFEDIFDSVEERNWEGTIFSSDISKPAIQAAMKNAREASVHKNINFRGVSFLGYPVVEKTSMAIINPPYGQRILQPEIISFYKAIGDTLKRSFKGSKVWIISSNTDALKHVGLKPSSKLVLFNGPLECGYHRFDIYDGSKKAKYQQ
ncbi:MAG: class I SAM-dependent RNA methyltransferase [Bacteroidales bacterium]|nr:class I SAM-dependent RNA methyltransferase [Bacteroidales bacterium]